MDELRAALIALREKWRAFARRTSEVVDRIPEGIMDSTVTRMRGLRDKANSCADDLDALLDRVPEGETADGNACINCGEANDGGYVIDNENESFVGPFCSQCWDYIRKYPPDAARRSPAPEQI